MMRLLSSVVSRRLGTRITDTTSGFRAMNRATIELFSRHYPVDYLSDTVEALLLAHDAGLRVQEIDVRMHQRTTGVPSATSLRATYHLVRLVLILVLHSIRRPLPKEAVR
jgi:putative NIF3 family GTP cyclohydrolase 1 type 2